MAARRALLSGLSENTFLLAFASLFADVSTEMLYPVLPTFLTQVLKANGAVVGLVEGAAVASQNIIQGLSGSLSDHLRRRKPIALLGFAVAALAKPLIGLAPAWPGVLGARVLDRLGAGARSAPRDALVAASADAENRGKAFGLEGAGDNLGAFLGPLLAVLLLGAFQIDIRWIFYLAVIPGALAFLMVLFVSEKPVEARSKATLDLSLHRFPGAYRRYLAATALFGVGNSSNAFLVLETQARGAALSTTILIYAGFNLVAALASYPAGALSDRIGRRNLIVLGFMVFLGTYLGFAARPGVPVIAFLFLLYGLFQGIYRSVGKALASDLAPEALRASGVGWYGATIGLSGLFASVVAGQLWDHVGHAAVFLYGAAFASLGGLSLLLLVRETAPNG